MHSSKMRSARLLTVCSLGVYTSGGGASICNPEGPLVGCNTDGCTTLGAI